MTTKLQDIISIGGKPGLHKIIGQRTNGLIAESLVDGKKFPTSITQKVSILSEISIYTYDGDVSLREVLEKMHEKIKGGLEPVSKTNSGEEIRNFFREVVADFDENQVYTSDILKITNWYQLLASKCDMDELLQKDEEEKDKDSKKDGGKKQKED